MNLKNIKNIIKERWLHYIIAYLIGYIIQLLIYGIKDWKSLFPVKMMGIACAILLGNAWYGGPKKFSLIEAQGRAMKYTAIMLVVFMIIFLLSELIFIVFGFDILLYIGME